MEGVKMTYGADEETSSILVGKDVGSSVLAARQLLSVPNDVEARLNGNAIIDKAVLLKDGDVLSFYKTSGTKGY